MKPHNSEPFWRESKGAWYCWIDGRQKSLGKKKRAAQDKYRELIAARDREQGGTWTVRECLDHYLDHAASMKANTLRNRKMILNAFCDEAKVGKLPWQGLTVDHMEAWLKSKGGWSSSYRRTAINCVMAAFNYCVKRRKIRENPIHGIAKPRWERRKQVLRPEDEKKIYEASKGAFRAILTALRETGARPNELCSARIEHYREGVIVLDEHKTDETGDDRIIYLNEVVRQLVEGLIGDRTDGHVFLNSRGEPWTPDTLLCRFKRLRKKLEIAEGAFPYALRHKFASDAINETDANPALVAKALGHRGMEVLMRSYFRENPSAMRKALEEMTRR